jgi:hypothetical protein
MEDMKTAMKAKDKLKLSVLRLALSSIKNREIEDGKELDDEVLIEVVSREVKQRREAMVEFQKADREDLVRKQKQEIEYLLPYLPKQLSESDIRKIVQDVIEQVGANDKRDIGKVMGAVMPQVKGKSDGKIVNNIVNELLG